jgi:ELWxxDGT repeat protein
MYSSLALLLPLLSFGLSPRQVTQTCPLPIEVNPIPQPYSSQVANMKAFLVESQSDTFVSDFAGHYYFVAKVDATGRELYKTDGTPQGTLLVRDIFLGGDSNPENLVGAQGRIYFFANDGIHGRELWTSDGTAAGTYLLLDAHAGPGDGAYTDLAVLGNKAIFGGETTGGEVELWSTDGTPAGTLLVADLNPQLSSLPSQFTRAPDGVGLYFTAKHPVFGAELWKTDGTANGTVFIKDLYPGSGPSLPNGSSIQNFVSAGGVTYFRAFSGGAGLDLWVTDGTSAGTLKLATFSTGLVASPQLDLNYATEFQGRLVFTAGGNSAGQEVWISDGTVAGTGLFIDVWPGPVSGFPFAYQTFGGNLYFAARPPEVGGGTGFELFRADGSGQAVLLKEFIQGPSGGISGNFRGFADLGTRLLFYADDGSGEEVWSTDGTPNGTQPLADLDPDGGSAPRNLTRIGPDQVLLSADTSLHGIELWTLSLSGQQQVLEVDAGYLLGGFEPTAITSIGNQRLFFAASVPGTGSEPYCWSPTTGVVALGDLRPGAFGSEPEGFTRLWNGTQERIVFSASTPGNGREAWITDGTPQGTQLLLDINPGTQSSNPTDFTEVGGKLVFSAFSQQHGMEPFVTDGTPLGTGLLVDLSPGSFSSEPFAFLQWRNRVVFLAKTSIIGDREFWLTDGTRGGTNPLFPAGASTGTQPLLPFVAGKLLYYRAEDPATGAELWVSDGTLPGTARISDTWAGSSDGMPLCLGLLGDTLLFQARDGGFDYQLFKTNGTAAGTVKVKNMNIQSGAFTWQTNAVANGYLFLTAEGASGQTELWRSDGTEAGTIELNGFVPPFSGSVPFEFTPVAGGIYYAANSAQNGIELCFSDGTAAGTRVICDLYPGSGSGTPNELCLMGGRLVMSAQDHPMTGRKLFSLPLQDAHVVDLGILSSVQLAATPPLLGSVMRFTASGIPASSPSLLLLSGPVAVPSGLLVDAGSANWLDPLSLSLLGVFPGGNWFLDQPIPNNPALAGQTVNAQAFALPFASLPAKASNALGLTLGQ